MVLRFGMPKSKAPPKAAPSKTVKPRPKKDKKKLDYLAEWIRYRGYSYRTMELRMEVEPGTPLISHESIRRIAKGEAPLTVDYLHAFAEALDCAPADLLTINPLMEGRVIDLLAVVRSVPSQRIDEAIAHIDVIARRA